MKTFWDQLTQIQLENGLSWRMAVKTSVLSNEDHGPGNFPVEDGGPVTQKT